METKHCAKCKTEQPFDYFVNDKNRPDGKFSYCKTCTSRNPKRFVRNYENKINGMKYCDDCDESKPVKEFYRNRSAKDGLSYQCIKCSRARRDAWYEKNPERRHLKNRDLSLFKNYGITTEVYDEMFEKQNGLCAICGSDDYGNKRVRYFFVDHDHVSNRVRGLLCSKCNQAIGLLGDSVENLKKAIEYLSRGAFSAKQVASPDKQVVERTAV
jgi:hypothetical protein